MKNIEINNGINYYNKLNITQQARWMSLLAAIDYIDNHCNKNNLRFNEEVLKPIPIKHFIEAKTNQIENFLIKEIKKNQFKHTTYNLKKNLKLTVSN